MVNFVIFEGPDCTGKTTQAKMLAELLSTNQNLVFYTHFPRTSNNLVGKELIKSYEELNQTLYNQEYLDSIKDSSDLIYRLQTLDQIIINNIYKQTNDKLIYLYEIRDNLMDFYFKKTQDQDGHNVYYNGKKIVLGHDNYKEVYNNCVSKKDITIILDRYQLSGNVYCHLLPIHIIKKNFGNNEYAKIMCNNYLLQMKMLSKNIIQEFNSILRILNNHFIDFGCYNKLDISVTQIIFKECKAIYEKSINDRNTSENEVSKLDSNDIIRNFINSEFDKLFNDKSNMLGFQNFYSDYLLIDPNLNPNEYKLSENESFDEFSKFKLNKYIHNYIIDKMIETEKIFNTIKKNDYTQNLWTPEAFH